MHEQILGSLTELYPSQAKLLMRLRDVSISAGALPFEPFREPVALVEQGKGGLNALVQLDAAMLFSWTHHIAYSMRVRLQSCEPAILTEIASHRLLPAAVLLRSHFEASAVAALCVESIQQSASTGDWQPIRALIPRTLFGTGLYSKAQKDERLQDMLTSAEQRAVTICTAVDALDSFAFRDKASGELDGLYGLLCEFSHPNQRGTRGFFSSKDLGEFGWTIEYAPTEHAPEELIQKSLETLFFSMRHGYAACELLRNMGFEDADTGFAYSGVPQGALAMIWRELLQAEY